MVAPLALVHLIFHPARRYLGYTVGYLWIKLVAANFTNAQFD